MSLREYIDELGIRMCDIHRDIVLAEETEGREDILEYHKGLRDAIFFCINGLVRCELLTITSHVVGRINDIPCEIEYRDQFGNVMGFWAYGSFDPSYPIQRD